MSTYGSIASVAAFVRHVPFDAANAPTSADVEAWLTARSAQLTAWLAVAGYTVPVTSATVEAKAILDRYASIGAAGDVELSLRSAGYSAEGEDARENRFLAEFAKAEAWIAGSALEALGVVRATDAALSPAAFSVQLRRV